MENIFRKIQMILDIERDFDSHLRPFQTSGEKINAHFKICDA